MENITWYVTECRYTNFQDRIVRTLHPRTNDSKPTGQQFHPLSIFSNRCCIPKIPSSSRPAVFRLQGDRHIARRRPVIVIRKATREDAGTLLTLINALADFEQLKRPSISARKRLIRDGFGRKKRYDALLAFVDGKPAGYAMFFETYSSFLALPTLYLEDIFVLPEYRKRKIGFNLFLDCVREAKKRGCGRMEWMVLDWNVIAIRFYRKLRARQLNEWLPFRINRREFSKILRTRRSPA